MHITNDLSGLSADEVIWEDVIGISTIGARLGLSAADYASGWLELVSATGGVCYWEQIWSRYAVAGCFGIRPTTPLHVSRVTDILVFVFFVLSTFPRRSTEWVFADVALNTLLRIVVRQLRQRLLAQCVAFSDASRTSASAGSSLDALVALKHQDSPRVRRIDPHTAWSLLARADQQRIALKSLALAVDNQPSFALSASSATKWFVVRVMLTIHKNLALFQGAKQISIALDPSTHSGQETCVSVAYSWRVGKGIIPPLKSFPAESFAFRTVSR